MGAALDQGTDDTHKGDRARTGNGSGTRAAVWSKEARHGSAGTRCDSGS